MAAKQSSTNPAARARFAASISFRLAPMLDQLVTMIGANLERDHDVRLALAERVAQLADALLVASHDNDRKAIDTALAVAGIASS